MQPFRLKLLLVLINLFVFHVEFSVSLIFEISRLLPNIEFTPVVHYKVGDQIVVPTPQNIIKANGYPVETHEIVTEDGYILEVHRIPGSKKSPPSPGKMPVILQHGNFQSSVDWVLNSPANLSLGFMLADNNYDVWLGNQRGNLYSNKHIKYPLSSHNFWNFGFHEMGIYDMPAVIDYVTKITGQPKVHYVGFSIGTTAMCACLSKRPEYNSKIGIGAIMGPSVFQDNFLNGAGKFLYFVSTFGNLFVRAFGAFPLLPHALANILHVALPLICNPKLDLLGVCGHAMTLVFGDDKGLITRDQLPLILTVTPSPSSFLLASHVIQLFKSRRFAEFDYGFQRNMELYNRPTPPDYNLTNIRAPIALFVGPNDFLAHRQDARELGSKLPNLIELYFVPYKHFTHLDFSYGKATAAVAYNHLIELFDNYNLNLI